MSSKTRSEQAESVVKNHVLISMGAGLVPIPVLDIAAVTAVQMEMIKQIGAIYDVDYPRSFNKSLITALTGSIFARVGASLIKVIPIIGSAIGGVSMAIMSGASTYAIGQVFIRHFENGGTFEDFDPASMKKIFTEEYEKGKTKAEQWKQENEGTESAAERPTSLSSDTIEKLKQLGELKESGVISEEEFQKMKANLLKDM